MSSDECSSEDKKRKAEEEMLEVFRKNKKLLRSPVQDKKKQEEKLEKITELVKEVLKEVKEVKQKQTELQEDIKEIKQENSKLRYENNEIRKEMESLKDTVEKLEKQRIKNNIIVTGMPINTNERCDIKNDMKNFLRTNIGIEVNIANAYKLGPTTCKLELEKSVEKMNVMKNKNKLKGSAERIYINHELTKQEIEIQKEIKRVAEEERRKGKRTKIGYQKLTVDQQTWKWDKKLSKLNADPKN